MTDWPDLANTTDPAKGDALVGVRNPLTSAVGRTQHQKNQDLLTPEDFGAIGDGVTDDTASMNLALVAVAAIPPIAPSTARDRTLTLTAGRVYMISDELEIPSRVRLIGNGATFRMATGFDKAKVLLKNKNSPAGTDTDIYIQDCNFDGNRNGLEVLVADMRTAPIVKMLRVTGVVVRGCSFKDVGYIGLMAASCINSTICESEFSGIGFDQVVPDGGCPLLVASFDASFPSKNTIVSNNNFHDNRWCVQVSSQGGTVCGNMFLNNDESGLYLARDPDQSPPRWVADGLTVTGNVIDGVTKRNVSSSGIECHLQDSVIVGNTIRNTGMHGISIMRGRNVVIEGNLIKDFAQDTSYTDASGICIYSGSDVFNDDTRNSYNITIRNNRIYDSGAAKAKYGIRADGTQFAHDGMAYYCKIAGNDLSKSSWKAVTGKAFYLPSDSWFEDSSVCVQGFAPYSGSVQPTAAGLLHVTDCPFKPNAVVLDAYEASTTRVITSHSNTSVNLDQDDLHTIPYVVYGYSSAIDALAPPVGNGKRVTSHIKAVQLITSATAAITVVFAADFVEFTDKGFDLQVGTYIPNVVIRYIAYP